MPYPLTLTQLLLRAHRLFSKKEIVSREMNGIFRYTYGDYYPRVCRLAHALKQLGVKRGDRVATFAWNSHRHLEIYFAVPCLGATLHTLNFRLFPDQITYIVNHAEDKILFVDEDLLPALEAISDKLKSLKALIVMSRGQTIPTSSFSPCYSYEKLLKDEPDDFEWPEDLDENSMAGLCYTTATTGNPKGVPYTHRGIFLQSLAISASDLLDLGEADVILPIVPMFHANAWGLPFTSTWMGAKQVFPGPRPDAEVIAQLIQNEKVTIAAGVPTVWMGFLGQLEKDKYDISSLRAVFCGGSAAPQAMIERFEKKTGAEFVHAYGMTETYPLATICRLRSYMKNLPPSEKYKIKAKQGPLVPGMEMKVMEENGKEAPWDGKTMGELLLRGPWVTDQYYRDPEQTQERIKDGWLLTGDVVTVDEEGYIQVQDRKKDLIKSGGEWISSIDLENAIMAHPAVGEAAVIGIPHEKWVERPMACIVLKPDFQGKVTDQDILEFLEKRVSKWWLPDRFEFLESIPKTSVGKFNKRALREKFISQENTPS